ncbi:DUF6090 family protein [Tamlana flava]|uniref:DUF6090 family protein n=1 Tax=Tamlana flava TaxID=3158572 RepID=UPI00351ABB6A
MIKFFRNIRKNLLAEGKTANYLKYAIGEIVLVVIGILIALQINNWNERRKQRTEEIEILKNIKSDFANTIIEFEENNAFKKRIISTSAVIYEVIHTKRNPYTEKQLDSLISELLINPTYNGQSETLNILFNSGKINIISNDSIKNKLVLWPQQVEDMTEDEVYGSNIVYNNLYPILKRYVSLYNVNNQLQYKFKLVDYSSQSSFTSDYYSLLNTMEFESTLASRELTISVSLILSLELIETAEEIIAMIDKEIKKLK